MKRAKKRVEYRWFVWQHETKLLGGVVAADADSAFYGLSAESRQFFVRNPTARMVRVKMEYPEQGVIARRTLKSGAQQ